MWLFPTPCPQAAALNVLERRLIMLPPMAEKHKGVDSLELKGLFELTFAGSLFSRLYATHELAQGILCDKAHLTAAKHMVSLF